MITQKQWLATIDEADGVVIATLSDDDKARIAATSKPDLIGLQFGLGTWIRNNLGLWHGNERLMQATMMHDPRCVNGDRGGRLAAVAVCCRFPASAPWALKEER